MVDILLVEDQKDLSNLMKAFLLKKGYTVYCAMTGEEAIHYLQEDQAKLVLLDIMLPGIDGFAVCSAIRKKGNTPIIILSARVSKEDKITGFQLGADDYVEKPVDIDIMIAKVEALFKRYYNQGDEAGVIHSGTVTIDQNKMKVWYQKQEIDLTIKEYDLLLLLVENKGKTLKKITFSIKSGVRTVRVKIRR